MKKSTTSFLVGAVVIGMGATIVTWQLSLNYMENVPRLVFVGPVGVHPLEARGGSELFVDVVLQNIQDDDVGDVRVIIRAAGESSEFLVDVPKEVKIGSIGSGQQVSQTVSVQTLGVEKERQISLEVVVVGDMMRSASQITSFTLLP